MSYTPLPEGTMTGFEPSCLARVPLPKGDFVHGYPGKGLSASRFSKAKKKAGRQGERLFARAMAKDGITNRYHTFWSVKIPDRNFQKTSKTKADVDCIIAVGRTLLLVDVKLYSSGAIVYRNVSEYKAGSYLIADGNRVGPWRHLSPNMSNANRVFSAEFSDYQVVPLVVFMPTEKGEALLDNLKWPGNVPALTYRQFRHLVARLARESTGSISRRSITALENLLS